MVFYKPATNVATNLYKFVICNSGHDHDSGITKEHFLKFVACLYGPNVVRNLLQTRFAPFTFSPICSVQTCYKSEKVLHLKSVLEPGEVKHGT